MLFTLRHDPVVRSYREQHQVDAVGTGQHVTDEALVAGHVHNPRPLPIGQIQVGEPQVDRDAALFFFLKPVSILAGERLD